LDWFWGKDSSSLDLFGFENQSGGVNVFGLFRLSRI
jgi:hypothetical protein